MYLSKKQIYALEIAIEAIDNFHSGLKDDEQEEACKIIFNMINSARKTIRKMEKRKRNV